MRGKVLAAISVGVVLLSTACTRTEQYVIVVNACSEALTVQGGDNGDVAIPSGGGADFLFDARPDLAIRREGHDSVDVLLDAWPDSPKASVWGVVEVSGNHCAPTFEPPRMEFVKDDTVPTDVTAKIPAAD